MNLTTLLLPGVFSLGLTWLITPLVIKFYRRRGWLDDPQTQTHPKVIHRYPVPRGGGVAIFSAILIAGLIFLPIDKHLLGILLGGLILMVTGILDDIYNLNPYLRLGLGLLAAGIVVMAGIGIAYISNPLVPGTVINLSQQQIPLWLFGRVRTIWVLADLIALVWILSTMNFVNWSKGLDGQLPGIVVVSATVIGILSLRFAGDVTQWPVITLAFILAGAYLGFLPYNFYPQKIMPGYGAGALAGYFLAVLAILSGAKLATAILVLGVPIIDAAYTVLRRLFAGRSPVWGDRGHLHHRLMDLGWGKRRIAVWYWLVSAILGFIALQLDSRQKLYTLVILGVIIGMGLLWLSHSSYYSRPAGRGKA